MKAAVIEEWDRPPVYTDHPEPQASGGAVVASVAGALRRRRRARGVVVDCMPGVKPQGPSSAKIAFATGLGATSVPKQTPPGDGPASYH